MVNDYRKCGLSGPAKDVGARPKQVVPTVQKAKETVIRTAPSASQAAALTRMKASAEVARKKIAKEDVAAAKAIQQVALPPSGTQILVSNVPVSPPAVIPPNQVSRCGNPMQSKWCESAGKCVPATERCAPVVFATGGIPENVPTTQIIAPPPSNAAGSAPTNMTTIVQPIPGKDISANPADKKAEREAERAARKSSHTQTKADKAAEKVARKGSKGRAKTDETTIVVPSVSPSTTPVVSTTTPNVVPVVDTTTVVVPATPEITSKEPPSQGSGLTEYTGPASSGSSSQTVRRSGEDSQTVRRSGEDVMPEEAFVDDNGVTVYYDDNGDLMYFDDNDEAQFYDDPSATKIIQPTKDGPVEVQKKTYIWDDWLTSINDDVKKMLGNR